VFFSSLALGDIISNDYDVINNISLQVIPVLEI
jgi:hypothetical protein